MRRVAAAVAWFLAASLVLAPAVSCAPPADPADAASARSGKAGPAARGGGAPTSATTDDAPAPVAGEQPAPRAAVPGDVARNVVLQPLRGGVLVPRCPECGETQPAGALSCAGCGQELVPWRRESTCPACEGAGTCRHCGDDRPCLACETSGRCAWCGGAGSVADARCDDCLGRGSCRECGGDGRRSGADGDFAPGESRLAGICGTCVDGSGLCPGCGGADGGCIACEDTGLCPDCRGTGACVRDRGDGLCATCGGAGREVLNGPPGSPADREWTVRRDDGSPLAGHVAGAPAPDLTVIVEADGKLRPQTLVPGKVDPISYYVAARDFTALDDAAGRVALAGIARERGLLALAARELERAATLEPGRTRSLEKSRREIRALRAQSWMVAAREAVRLGERDGAHVLYAMAARTDPESGPAVAAALLELDRTQEREEVGLDDAARERARDALRQRIVRTVARAEAALERAGARLAVAQDTGMSSARVRLAFASADRAAQQAEELIRADARRSGAAGVAWPVTPRELLLGARRVRARIAYDYAGAEVAAGRFELARRLALTARALEPVAGGHSGKAVLEAAERGMMRRGVRIATPPPDEAR